MKALVLPRHIAESLDKGLLNVNEIKYIALGEDPLSVTVMVDKDISEVTLNHLRALPYVQSAKLGDDGHIDLICTYFPTVEKWVRCSNPMCEHNHPISTNPDFNYIPELVDADVSINTCDSVAFTQEQAVLVADLLNESTCHAREQFTSMPSTGYMEVTRNVGWFNTANRLVDLETGTLLKLIDAGDFHVFAVYLQLSPLPTLNYIWTFRKFFDTDYNIKFIPPPASPYLFAVQDTDIEYVFPTATPITTVAEVTATHVH